MPRPIYATIRPAAVAHNLGIARALAPHTFLWAVIKANAYGHGIEAIYSGLQGADGVALLDFSEAQRIRTLGWKKPILMLEGCFDTQDITTCQALDLTPMIHSWAQLTLHAQQPPNAAGSVGAAHAAPLTVQIKVNSGMNRLGFALHELPKLSAQLMRMPHIKVGMWVTHFADADAVHPTQHLGQHHGQNQSQNPALAPLGLFEAAVRDVMTQHPNLQAPLSTSNSAAIGALPAAHHGAVRCGIMAYGSSPYASQSAAQLGLQPVMVLSSRLIAVQDLKAGDCVGYGSTFQASSAMRIGIVACGYADGYPRHAPTGTPIAVDGVLTRTLGRVSMDMLAVDLSPVPAAHIGSAVELWGEQVPIDAVAHAAGTIGYELMCALAPRVPIRLVID